MTNASPLSRGLRALLVGGALMVSLVLAACGAPAAAPADAETPAAPHGNESAAEHATAEHATATQSTDPTASTGAEQSTGQASATGSSGAATLEMAGESFSFSLNVCMFDDESLLASGPGVGNESGEPAYLDIDVVYGAGFATGGARVDLDSDEQFRSSDRFYSLSIDSGDDYGIVTHATSFVLEAQLRFAGENQIGPGTFTVEC